MLIVWRDGSFLPLFRGLYYKNTGYDEKYSEPEIVRDYIAGMTDRYFESTFTDLFLPQKCRYTIDECEKSTLSPKR